MKLNEFLTWKNEVITYWENEIENSTCSEIDKDNMNTTLNSYLDNLESSYNSYLNKSETDMELLLEMLYGYVSLKYKVIVDDPNAPTIPELISSGDIRTMFNNWTYDLTGDYSTLFSISVDGVTGDCQLDKETAFTNIENAISNSDSDDRDEIDSFRNSFPGAVRKSMIFRMYKQPLNDIQDFDVRCYCLQDMYLQEVLDSFNLSINGVNINVDECP